MEAEAERIGDLLHRARRQEVARDAGRAQARGVVDLEVDEPGKEQWRTRSAQLPAHLYYDSGLNFEHARERALDRVNDKSL